MYQITEEEIAQEIINQYIPQDLKEREKLIRNINNSYQYSRNSFREANEGNYSFIENLLKRHCFEVY